MQYASIYLGSINRNAFPVLRYASAAYWRSSYNNSTYYDDIGLVRMNDITPTGLNIRPIALPSRSQASLTYLNTILTMSGWGRMNDGQLANNLQYTDVIGISEMECRSSYGAMIVPTILCTRGYPDLTQGVCPGDGGGALITKTYPPVAVAINTFMAAIGCSLGYPQGYTKIGPYLDWISSYTGIPVTN